MNVCKNLKIRLATLLVLFLYFPSHVRNVCLLMVWKLVPLLTTFCVDVWWVLKIYHRSTWNILFHPSHYTMRPARIREDLENVPGRERERERDGEVDWWNEWKSWRRERKSDYVVGFDFWELHLNLKMNWTNGLKFWFPFKNLSLI